MRRLDFVFVFIAAAACITAFIIQFPLEQEPIGFPLDDGWIHATYARNLAERGEFAFNHGEPSTGTTSLLWTVLLSVLYNITGQMVITSLFLGTLGYFFFAFSFFSLSKQFFNSRWFALLATLLTVASGFTLWWSLSGMETILFLGFGIASIDLYSKKKYVLSSILLSLMTLTRPEGVILAFILIVHHANQHRQQLFTKEFFRFSFLSLAGGAMYIAWNLLLTGRLVTSTLAGRRWLAHAPIDIPLDPLFHLNKAVLLIIRWLRFFAFSYIPQYEKIGSMLAGIIFTLIIIGIISTAKLPRAKNRITLSVLFVIGCAFLSTLIFPESLLDSFLTSVKDPNHKSFFLLFVELFESTGSGISGKRIQILGAVIGSSFLTFSAVSFLNRHAVARSKKNVKIGNSALNLFLWWTLLHNIMYIIFIPYPGHGGRYQAMNLLLLIILGMFGLKYLFSIQGVGSARRKFLLLLQCVIVYSLVHVSWYAFWNWRGVYFSTVHHINTIHKQSAQWMNRHLPANARVAAYDIGALGYFTSRYIIDIGGLIQPKAIPYMAQGKIDEFIITSGATHLSMMYLLDEKRETNSIAKWLGINSSGLFKSIPLYDAQFDSLAWRHNVSIAANAYPILRVSAVVQLREKSFSYHKDAKK